MTSVLLSWFTTSGCGSHTCLFLNYPPLLFQDDINVFKSSQLMKTHFLLVNFGFEKCTHKPTHDHAYTKGSFLSFIRQAWLLFLGSLCGIVSYRSAFIITLLIAAGATQEELNKLCIDKIKHLVFCNTENVHYDDPPSIFLLQNGFPNTCVQPTLLRNCTCSLHR